MTIFCDPPMNKIGAALLAVAAVWLAARSARLVARGLREARALDVVRAIRVLVLSLVSALSAVGLLTGNTGFLVVGAIILAEELYETGVVVTLLRLSDSTA